MSDFSAAPDLKKRPTSLTVMGVLGIVFASLGILGAFGGAAGALCTGTLFTNVFNNLPQDLPQTADSASGMLRTAQELMQVLMIYLVIASVAGLAASAVGLIGSIGLVTDKRWSRNLCLAYAIMLLAYNILHTVVYSIIILPPYVKMMEQAAAWAPSSGANPFGNAFMGQFQLVMTVVGGVLGCVFPILFLIFLNTSKAKAYFEKLRAQAA